MRQYQRLLSVTPGHTLDSLSEGWCQLQEIVYKHNIVLHHILYSVSQQKLYLHDRWPFLNFLVTGKTWVKMFSRKLNICTLTHVTKQMTETLRCLDLKVYRSLFVPHTRRILCHTNTFIIWHEASLCVLVSGKVWASVLHTWARTPCCVM